MGKFLEKLSDKFSIIFLNKNDIIKNADQAFDKSLKTLSESK